MTDKRISVLDFVEISQPSSHDLRENVGQVLENSASYSAAVASLDKLTGTYKIILQGTLKHKQMPGHSVGV